MSVTFGSFLATGGAGSDADSSAEEETSTPPKVSAAKHARARVSDREQSLFMGRPWRALKIALILHLFREPTRPDIFLALRNGWRSLYHKQLVLPWEAVQ